MKIKILFVICMMILLVPSASSDSGIQVTQQSELLIITSEQDGIIQFYNSHQQFIEESNFEKTKKQNTVEIIIPEALAISGGYFRVAYNVDEITSQLFQEITPWLIQPNVNNDVQTTKIIEEVEIAIVDPIDDEETNDSFILFSSVAVSALYLKRRSQ